jgi:hypothetical protein
MKRFNLLFTCLILFCGFAVAQNDKISFNETSHDFGEIGERDGNATCEFILTNNSDAPIVITNVQASCGCTKPVWTKEPIEPKKTGTISVSYNPLGRPGSFNKTISVFMLNQTNPIQLKIVGNVVSGEVANKKLTPEEQYPIAMGAYLLKTKDLNFSKIGFKESKSIKLEVFNNSDKPLTQQAVKLPKYLTVAFSPEVIPAKTAATMNVTMEVLDETLFGNLAGKFSLLINGAPQTLSYSATVLDDFSVWTATKKANAGKINLSSTEINFGNFTSGASRTLKISNSGKSPLTVRNIQSSNPSITVSKPHFVVNPGEIAEVKINVDTKKIQSKLSSSLSIFTDDPNMPVSEITVLANKNT